MKAFAALALAVALSLPMHAYALGLPFGGIITAAAPCPCGGEVVTVLNPIPFFGGVFLDPPTSLKFPFFFNKPLSYILGDYIPGGACCTVPVQGIIIKKGTSL